MCDDLCVFMSSWDIPTGSPLLWVSSYMLFEVILMHLATLGRRYQIEILHITSDLFLEPSVQI